MNDYGTMHPSESEVRERIAKALFELDMQKSRDNYCPSAIRRILEGGTA